ncbi:hypothetical protein TWF106_008054 [Orbilia oligospora]|uniref:Uncharacterized protein n=1 Tax=Orbilia oligospora TaxID=2813651 RepID=A0A6G1M4U0_ORBOL|nr:hypothetical protein TWF191_004909 [Orbilia oligospora]KAF3217004.1 hypothetical protein TWF106_008054 [Orbilia oligospora]KAF3245562.1 hypothetical protein TWF192_007427 [Orbilia oligospora]
MAHTQDKLLDQTSFAVADVYEYQHAKMYMTYFCQGQSLKIYQIKSLYRDGSPTIIENPTCQVSTVSSEAAGGTPLATVVHYDGPGVPTVHLFYLDKSYNIREVIWVNGEQTAHNNLSLKAARNSDLSAIYWRQDKTTTCMRLYFQAEDGSIQEYDRAGSGPWRKGVFFNFDASSTHTHEKPHAGTSLSFINLSLEEPNIRGFWQAEASNAIVEGSSQGLDWSIRGRTVEVFPSHVPIAAAWEGKRPNTSTAFYHVTNGDIYKTVIGDSPQKINTTPTDQGSRIAVTVAPSDGGVHVITSGNQHIIRRVFPKNGRAWKDPIRITLESSSPLAN